MTLTRAQILDANDLERIEVPVSEWGGSVFVRSILAEERAIYEEILFDAKVDEKVRNRRWRGLTLSLCVVDEHGAHLFTEADIDALGKKNANAVDKVFKAALKLNALTEAEVQAHEKK